MTFKARCSKLKEIMSNARSGGGMGETAKQAVLEQALQDVYGCQKQLHTPAIKKGLMLEETAIRAVGLITASNPAKNTERRKNDWISGECDLLTADAIRDVKCCWSIDTFPWTQAAAEKKVKASGYDWQGQGYMWLWDKPVHYVDFILLPTPLELLRNDDDYEYQVSVVEKMPLKKRIKTVRIERDESLYPKIEKRVSDAREYYAEIVSEIGD